MTFYPRDYIIREKDEIAELKFYQKNKEIINNKQKIYRDKNKERINKLKREKTQKRKQFSS
jgi:hypothetical protein